MKSQQKMLGFSYDWSREITTCNEAYYKWNQWIFLKFFEKGLAYKKEAYANWCNSCKTVLANEQVHEGKCWRCKNEVSEKSLEQWFFKIRDYADELLNYLEKLDWPEQVKIMQWNEPPKMAIDVAQPYIATLETTKGEMKIELFTKENPFALMSTINKNKSSAPAKAGQTSPKDIIVIEDSKAGVEAAKKAGMRVIGIEGELKRDKNTIPDFQNLEVSDLILKAN